MTQQEVTDLESLIKSLSGKIRKFQDRSLGEQNTKAALIEPMIRALGWDTLDPDEVHREYKPKSKDSPVDYALKMLRKPRLFVEAKGLGENLSDRKWISQILGYATMAGVVWCVLTDGNEYRIYNASAPVEADEKLFKKIRIEDDPADAARTLDLISRSNMEENLLDVFWTAQFIDRRVKEAVRSLIAPPSKGIIRLIRKLHPELVAKAIHDSLNRLDIQVESPDFWKRGANPTAHSKPSQTKSAKQKRRKLVSYNVSLADLVGSGLLVPPVHLVKKYKGHVLKATILQNGEVEFQGKRYSSCSTAAEYARGSITGRRMHTNGWTFWQVNNSDGKRIELDDFRKRHLARSV